MKTGKRLLSLLCASVIMLSGVFAIAPIANADLGDTVFVSTDGSDETGDGSEQAPFASVARAWSALKEAKENGKLCEGLTTVYLRGGRYELSESILLGEGVSDQTHQIEFAAYKDETVTLSGGKTVDYSAFTSVAGDAMASRFDASVRDRILVCDLAALGITGYDGVNSGKDDVIEISVDRTLLTRGRYPNESDGFLRFPESETVEKVKGQLRFDDGGILAGLADIETVRIFGYLNVDYFAADIQPLEIGENYVSVKSDQMGANSNFYYYNSPEFVDIPGEYFIDAKTGKLYVYPTENFSTATISVSQLSDPLISVDGADYLTFRGLHLTSAKKDGVFLYGDHLHFVENRMDAIGGTAIRVSGVGNLIEKNDIEYIGATGIDFRGGSFEEGIPSDSVVYNNKILRYARHGYTYNAGVGINGDSFQLVVRNNEIGDSIHNAIVGGCYEGLIEYNYIHDVCSEASDAGAIYTGGWNCMNYTIRYNYILRTVNRYFFAFPSGIYVDDGGSNKRIYGNIVDTTGGFALLIGGGHNNIIYNNLLINTVFNPINYDERQYYGRGQYQNTLYPKACWGILDSPATATEDFLMMYMPFSFITYTNEFDPINRFAHGAVGIARARGNVKIQTVTESGELIDDSVLDLTKKFLIYEDNPLYSSTDDIKMTSDYQFPDDSPIYNKIPYWENIDFAAIGTVGW